MHNGSVGVKERCELVSGGFQRKVEHIEIFVSWEIVTVAGSSGRRIQAREIAEGANRWTRRRVGRKAEVVVAGGSLDRGERLKSIKQWCVEGR